MATNQCDKLNFATGKSRMSIVISVLEEWAAIVRVAKVFMDHNVIYMCVCVCVCVYARVCVRERERDIVIWVYYSLALILWTVYYK